VSPANAVFYFVSRDVT